MTISKYIFFLTNPRITNFTIWKMQMSIFRVFSWPSKKIYQYKNGHIVSPWPKHELTSFVHDCVMWLRGAMAKKVHKPLPPNTHLLLKLIQSISTAEMSLFSERFRRKYICLYRSINMVGTLSNVRKSVIFDCLQGRI